MKIKETNGKCERRKGERKKSEEERMKRKRKNVWQITDRLIKKLAVTQNLFSLISARADSGKISGN